MEKAKQTVNDFVASSGNHKTTVDEAVRPSVTDEHVHPHKHENVITAVDKDVHQHHHHTVVQPLKNTETLPEKHTHRSVPVEHKVFHHDNEPEVRSTLDQDVAKYKDDSVTHATTHSSTAAPVITGERVHHHVHEHIQPIIQKETIAPEVVHTTVPIHETHHAQTVHHGTSTLPAKTVEEWKNDGGVLSGRGVQTLKDTAGCPAPYKKELQSEQMSADKDMHMPLMSHKHATSGAHDMEGSSITRTRGMQSSQTNTMPTTADAKHREDNISGIDTHERGIFSAQPRKTSSVSDKAPNFALGSGAPSGMTSDAGKTASVPRGVEMNRSNETHKSNNNIMGDQDTSQAHRKVSLVDKLNPFKDADGDGKKGFMD